MAPRVPGHGSRRAVALALYIVGVKVFLPGFWRLTFLASSPKGAHHRFAGGSRVLSLEASARLRRRLGMQRQVATNPDILGGKDIPMYPDGYVPGSSPTDGVAQALMNLDPEVGEAIDNFLFISALLVTAVWAKENIQSWQRKSKEEFEIRRQKIRRALNPDGWREEIAAEDARAEAEEKRRNQGGPGSKLKEVMAEIYGGEEKSSSRESSGRSGGGRSKQSRDEEEGLTDSFSADTFTRKSKANKAAAGRVRRRKAFSD
eukprot:TRINITY_DN113128_c0_g1_i1.p1 TRINITY_DN113128_c0_g1~~TRINITY_DN113128_c0_g1_i1.p1  ORF type:complete len:287 (+),score=59.37 TRINITY_DN113128_c0_g1_i1:83-862(+)